MKSFFVKLTGAFVIFLLSSSPVYAQTKGAFLDKELEHFKGKGAKGYLIWQYSGDHGNPLGDTDKFSLYNGDLGDPGDAGSICGVMKKWSDKYEFLGFNVYSLGQGRGGPLSAGQIAGVLNPLKACGTNVVRVFIGRSCGNNPAAVPECVGRMAAGAGSAGVRLILTVGDAANGGGGIPGLTGGTLAGWFGGGYLSSLWPTFLQNTAAASAGNGNIYGIELANEPHCGPINAAGSYNQWASYGMGIAKGASGNVGIGQAASDVNDSCDGANTNLLTGNKVAGATMVSAHYYNDDQRSAADADADKIVPAGLKFYIGEAALLGLKKFPAGKFLPNDPIEVPKTVETKKNPDVSIGSSITDAGAGLDTSFFEGATFYDASIPNNKLNEVFRQGKLLPSVLVDEVQNPSDQDYPPGSPEELGHYFEVYDPGCTESHFVGGKQSSGEHYAKEVAKAKLPPDFSDLQANLHDLRSILVPEQLTGESNTLKWQIRDPGIAVKGADGKFTLNGKYATRFHCNDKIDPKQVAAVSVPVIGPIQAIFSAVSDIVTSAWSLITGQVTVCDSNGKNCYSYNKYKATLETINTAGIKTPAMEDFGKTATGRMGALGAFHPASVKERWPKDHGFTTNKNLGDENVLAASTDPNDPNSLPHGGTYKFAKTWQLTSSCMLIPASIQQNRGTKCELEPPSTPTLTPAPIPGNAINAAGWKGSVKLPPGFTTWAALTDDQIRYLEQQVANLAACHGAGVTMDSSKCPEGEPRNVPWTNSQLGNASEMHSIITQAKSSGLNPVFVMALGIEETHMGDAGNRVFGCGPSGAFTGVQNSFTCLSTRTVDPATGQQYLTNKSLSPTQSMCIYAYGDRSGNCFNNQSIDFPSAISTYINTLNPPAQANPTIAP